MRILPAGIYPGIALSNSKAKEIEESGFTLVELIVAMALISVLAGSVMVSLSSVEQSRDLDLAAQLLVTELRFAETLAVTEGVETRVYFDNENESYEIWSLPAGTDEMEADGGQAAVKRKEINLQPKVRFGEFNFQEGAVASGSRESGEESGAGWPEGRNYIAFYPAHSATAAVITLENSLGQRRQAEVKPTGRVNEVADETVEDQN